jgi:hypothetical protein
MAGAITSRMSRGPSRRPAPAPRVRTATGGHRSNYGSQPVLDLSCTLRFRTAGLRHSDAPAETGRPFALGLMAAVCGSLYFVFKRRGWL